MKVPWAAVYLVAGVHGQTAAQEDGGSYLERIDFKEPASQLKLAPSLREVSGLAISGDRLFAHDDEDGIVLELDPVEGDVLKWIYLGPPRVRGDFEGLAAMPAGGLVLVTSGGTFASFEEAGDGESVPYRAKETGLAAQCEVEGLTESQSGRLLVVCKTNRSRELKNGLQIYAFDAVSFELDPEPVVRLAVGALQSIGLKGIRPSGISELPTGHLLVLAAQGRVILELDASYRPVAWVKLEKRFHRQPEGIAVTAGGDLLIADEGGRGRARLTRYSPRDPG